MTYSIVELGSSLVAELTSLGLELLLSARKLALHSRGEAGGITCVLSVHGLNVGAT